MNKYFKITTILTLILFFFLAKAEAEELLSWQECIREAAKNHPDLIAAQEIVKQSEAEKNITASTLYPQIEGSVNAQTAKNASETTGASTGDSYNYGVTGTQLIFDAAKTINNVNAASEEVVASKEGFRFTSATVRYRLRTAFINLLTVQENLKITQEIYNIRRANLELITLRYASGLEHKGALLTAEADLANAAYGISQAQRNVEVVQRDLAKELGRSYLSSLVAKGDFEVRESVKQKPDFEFLAKKNPSLLQITALRKSADFGIKSAYANFSPVLSGQAGASKTGTHWTPKGDEWNLGLVLSMPIFEGGLRVAQVSQARALFNQLSENERSTKDSVVLNLEQTWAVLQDAMDNVEVQRKNLIATEERSKIAQAQYSIGFISFDNWTIIEDNLVKAKSTFLYAQANSLLAEAAWIQAKGETIEYE